MGVGGVAGLFAGIVAGIVAGLFAGMVAGLFAGDMDEVVAGMVVGMVAGDMDEVVAGERRYAEGVWHGRFLSRGCGARRDGAAGEIGRGEVSRRTDCRFIIEQK